jgi:L-lactate dehydrogenase complex protein LldG
LGALSGRVYRVSDREEVVPLILEIARQHQATSLLAWDEPLPGAAWLAPALSQAGLARQPADLPRDGAGRKAQLAELESLKVGLTGAAGGLADTGAIALVSGPGRSRLASLLPPVHIALLATDRLYPSLPAFLAANPGATGQGSNLVFIAGPSRTGDIELTLSMGVHGPGEIHVIITPPAG